MSQELISAKPPAATRLGGSAALVHTPPRDTSREASQTHNAAFDLIDELMSACLDALPAMSAVAVAIADLEPAVRARSADSLDSTLALVRTQDAIGSISGMCDNDQSAFVDFHALASERPDLARPALNLGFDSVNVFPLLAWGSAVGTVSFFGHAARALTPGQLRKANARSSRATRGFLSLGTDAHSVALGQSRGSSSASLV